MNPTIKKAIAAKVLHWLRHGGLKYEHNGIISGAAIFNHCIFKLNGKPRRLRREEVIKIVSRLLKEGQIEVIKGKGVVADSTSLSDQDLGL